MQFKYIWMGAKNGPNHTKSFGNSIDQDPAAD